jgi:transcriptional regulator with XRE-family HTH domain
MTSSSLRLDKRRRTYVRLIGEIRHALNAALAEESVRRGLTRTGIARLLGTHKSVISRKFKGTSNMTLETLADLAFALDRPVHVTLPARDADRVGNSNLRLKAPETETAPPVDSDDRRDTATAT